MDNIKSPSLLTDYLYFLVLTAHLDFSVEGKAYKITRIDLHAVTNILKNYKFKGFVFLVRYFPYLWATQTLIKKFLKEK